MVRVPDVRVPRWGLVAIVTVAMGVAGTYQFGWSSIRVPLGARLAASETALGTVFTLFVVFQTVSQFPAGWVRDRWGPRIPTAVGGFLLAASYAGLSWAPTITYASLFYGLGGVGVGAVYTVAINTPVKWFDERRGLATGVVGFAYAGLSFAVIPFAQGELAVAFERTMLGLAVLVGVLTLAGVPFLRDPDGVGAGDEQAATDDGDSSAATGQGYTWRETIRTWQFWLLYGVFVLVNGAGLMVIGKVVAFAEAMQLPAAAAGAASLVALGDGAGVIAGGSAADRFGHERTMTASLVVCGGCLAGATLVAAEGFPAAFVGLIAAASFFRSPAFAVFPSLVGDYYGTGHSSENYAALYSAKLWGGVIGGTVTSALIVDFGWQATFLSGAVLLVAAGIGIAFLRPVAPFRP
jgi:OFA family oxalate/formate antiporter-like MFS transporter